MAQKIKGRPAKDRRITAGGFTQITEERHKLDIILQSPELFHFDIGSYMSSLNSATAIDMYNRARLYDMYSSAFMTDPHLIGIHRKRLVGACRTPIEFIRNEKADDQINDLLKQPWFRRFRKEVVESEFWGFSLLQFYLNLDGSIGFDSIPRKHYDPVRQLIMRYQSDCDGAPIDAFTNTLLIGDEPRSLGVMSAVIPYVLYKRGDIGDWAQFCQIFGMPIREYTYDAGDEEARKRLIADARKQGANAVYIHPADSSLQLHESGNKSGSSDLYSNFADKCDSQMSIAILGNTLTTDAKATGTQALGTVHKQEEDEIKEEDEALILAVLNSAQMRKILANLGFNVENGEFRFIEVKNVDKRTQLDVVTKLMEHGLPVDDDYLYDTFDIDKPAEYDAMKAEAQKKADEKAAQQQALMQKLQGDNKNNQPQKQAKTKDNQQEPSDDLSTSFWNRVKSFFSEAPQDGADFPF